MSEFNDPELEKLLGRAGGAYPDVNIAYEQLQGRVRHARRRRAVVVSGVACSLLFATALVAANRTTGSSPAQIGDRTSFEATIPDETLDDTVNTADDSSVDSTNSSVPDTRRGGNDPATPVTSAHGHDGDTTSSEATTTTAAPITSVYSGVGGSITVRLEDGTLSLLSYTASSGYASDVKHDGGDRVEVRFESPDHSTRIRVDLKDGSLVPSIEET